MPEGQPESHKRKSRIKGWVAKAVGAIGKIPVIDAVVGTKYARDFSSVVAAPQTKPYLIPQEMKDPDEGKIINALVKTFVDDTREDDDMPKRIGLKDGALNDGFQDPHWGHTTGHLVGELEITEEGIGKLHEDLRVGLYKSAGTYPVYARPNFLYDPNLPIAINRLSLKLKMTEPVPNVYSETAHELDLLLSEGLPAGSDKFEPDGQGFFFRDARQLLMANEMKDGLISLAKVLFDKTDATLAKHWKTYIFERNTNMLYRGYQVHRTWGKKWYFSAGPYALGPGVMKFALEPEDTTKGKKINIYANPDAEAQPSEADYHPAKEHAKAFDGLDGEIRFKLRVQVATEASIPEPEDGDPPKCVMAAEYTDIAWNTKHAPFVEVGTLTLRPHEVDRSDPENRWYAMGFNAWNTFKEMKPLGQLFRAREEVHKAHRAARLEHSFDDPDTSPKLGRCPFSS